MNRENTSFFKTIWVLICFLLASVTTASGCGESPENEGSKGSDLRGKLHGEPKLLNTYAPVNLQLLLGLASTALGEPLDLEVKHGVVVYKIGYETIDATGNPTTASGAVAVPTENGQPLTTPLPVISYQHGTLLLKNEAPSRGVSISTSGAFEASEILVGIALASTGYIAVMPDYVGLGDSPGRHPYVHAASEASAVIDMLRATRALAKENGFSESGQLFLMGYSQGGHATLAAQQEIERNHADEFEVTASAAGAGPYDLSGSMVDVMLAEEPYPRPFYLPYVLLAYNDTYDIGTGQTGLFKTNAPTPERPYSDIIPALFDGKNDATTVNKELPPIPIQVLTDAFVQGVRDDANHPLRRALAENDLYDWAPKAPIRLYHCSGDVTVSVCNSAQAFKQLRINGGSVELIDPFRVDASIDDFDAACSAETPSGGDHSSCALPSLLGSKLWIDSLVQ